MKGLLATTILVLAAVLFIPLAYIIYPAIEWALKEIEEMDKIT